MKKLLLFAAFSCLFNANAQLRLVKNISVGAQNSNPASLFVFNGRLFFSATAVSGNTQRYVYYSDGTTIGTLPLRFDNENTGPYAINSTNAIFYEYNSNLYLDAKNSSTPNIQIASLSGSSNFCTSIFDLTGYSASTSSRFTQTIGINNKLIFNPLVATTLNPVVLDLQNSSNNGELYNIASNGDPKEMTALGVNCFFAATDSASGRELWKTDGTSTGTSLYLDLNAGTANSDPDNLNVLGTQLTFVATHPTFGRELFKTNGTGSLVLINNINPSGDSNPTNIAKIGGILYFSADNGVNGKEIWSSNGNNTGTNMIKDINPSGDSNPSNFTLVGSDVYFTADDGIHGVELWKTDGTNSGTVMVKDIYTTGSGNPSWLTEYNGKLYFVVYDGTFTQNSLWVTDGTNLGTYRISSSGILGSSGLFSPTNLKVFNNELFFSAFVNHSNPALQFGIELYAYMDPALATENFQLDDSKITLYPNPSNNYFELSGDVSIEKVEIYSLQGQLVKSFEAQNQYDVSNLSKGMFLVKINTVEGSLNKSLLIK